MVNKGIKAIPLILSSRYINLNAEEGGNMNFGYRPLTKAMFAVEHQFFGENPGMSHFINIILYALTLLLLFSILRKLMANYSTWFPFLVVMLWAAHPVPRSRQAATMSAPPTSCIAERDSPSTA